MYDCATALRLCVGVFMCVCVCVIVSLFISLIDHKVILSLIIGSFVCQNHHSYYKTELINFSKVNKTLSIH